MTSISPDGQVRVGVALGAQRHLAGDRDAVLAAQAVRDRLVADDHLRDAAGLAQVEEGHAAVVAATRHPAGEGDGLSGVGGASACRRRGCGSRELLLQGHHAGDQVVEGTASCSPVFMSFSWATPASRSRSPSTTTYGRPPSGRRPSSRSSSCGRRRRCRCVTPLRRRAVASSAALRRADPRDRADRDDVRVERPTPARARSPRPGTPAGSGRGRAPQPMPTACPCPPSVGHQAVVAAAAADRGLRAEPVVHELERGARCSSRGRGPASGR